mgnify:CR=1 FL=1
MEKKGLFNKLRSASIILSILCLIAAVVLLLRFVSHEKNENMREQVPAEVTHRVLFISSFNPLYFTYDAQVRGLEKSLYPKGIEYDVLWMDALTYNTPADTQAFHDFVKARLSSHNGYDAVLLGDDNALSFAMQYQSELFAGMPMLFFGINDLALAGKAAQNPYITGFYESNYIADTITIATKLFPHAKTLVALHDRSSAGLADMAQFFTYASQKSAQYTFDTIDCSKLSQDELIAALENLPEDALLFYMTSYMDKDGNVYSMLARTNTVVKHANVPIFRNYVGGEGEGIIGGVYMDFEEQCAMAGGTISDVLSGISIAKIPFVMQTPSHSQFDWQLLQKYNLDMSLLPEDATIYNQPKTFINQYGHILPTAVLIAIGLILLVLAAQFASWGTNMINDELRLSHDQLERSQQDLRYQAEYDEVLDILNRRTITDYMRDKLVRNDVYSVVIIDIDGFKALNENYGHSLADSILQYLVAIFKEMAESGDWKVARYGGDEFLLLIANEHLTQDHPTVQKIMEGIRAPIPLGDETLAITASIGISNSDGITLPEQHIVNAETAMYEAKDHGRNGVAIYGDEMKEKMREEIRIKEKLLSAFENDGFFMVYQPQINAQTKKVSGYEALVRMKEPGIYPGQFIPVAERSGWIWRIGRITTELAIKQLAMWRDAGHELHPVSVNYSSNQLNDHGYIEFVAELLEKYNVPAQYLEIEITEGLFLEKSALADDIFKRFKQMGIRLLMDDFGTGYSSLGYLTYIPVDVIKLDKSLVDTYLVDGKDSFIKNIIRLMHDLGKEMIIEGVEEKWQFERLRDFSADVIQGYYFSKPIPADEAIVFTVGDDK